VGQVEALLDRLSTRHGTPEQWRALPGFDGLGVHADFFDLHGHSLPAAQVTCRPR
jgi:hypothetical protein